MFFKVNGSLFSLAAQGLRRSKGKALRVLAVLALSFGFALASLSLSASIQATNQEFAKNIYGEWYLGVLAGQERDGAWLSRQRWLDPAGHGPALGPGGYPHRPGGAGHVGRRDVPGGPTAPVGWAVAPGRGRTGGGSGGAGPAGPGRPPARPAADPARPDGDRVRAGDAVPHLYPLRGDPALYRPLGLDQERHRPAHRPAAGQPGGGRSGGPIPAKRSRGRRAGVSVFYDRAPGRAGPGCEPAE